MGVNNPAVKASVEDGMEIHPEKPIDQHEIVAQMNSLDPPVTPEEERRVRRKIDMRLPPFLLILYVFTWLDRSALGNAALMNIKEDLGFSSSQFSLAVSMFFIGTCIADPFTNIGMRYIRPSYYLAGAMVCEYLQNFYYVEGAKANQYSDHLGYICHTASGCGQPSGHVCNPLLSGNIRGSFHFGCAIPDHCSLSTGRKSGTSPVL